jgi:hypothetical protein
MKIVQVKWHSSTSLPSKSYICGNCGNSLASEHGYPASLPNQPNLILANIYICHFCFRPTYFDIEGNQIPGSPYGNKVNDLPSEVEILYNEARNCTSCNSYTASVLCSRKLLMNIAVSKGAKEGLKFIEYVEYLSNNNYIPPNGKDWVDHIRTKGNEATHEILIMKKEDAEDLITFIEMLLKFIYEFPATIKRKKSETNV